MNTTKLLKLAEKMADRGHEDLATIVRDVVADEELEAEISEFEADLEEDDSDVEADFDLDELEADFDLDELDLEADFDLDELEADLDLELESDFDLDELEAELEAMDLEADLDDFDLGDLEADFDLEADLEADLDDELEADLDEDTEADFDDFEFEFEADADEIEYEADFDLDELEAELEAMDLEAELEVEYADDVPATHTAQTLFEDEHFWWETRRAAFSSEENLHFVTRVAQDSEDAIRIGEIESEKGMLALLTGGTADAWGQLTSWAASTYKNNNEKRAIQRLATWAGKNSNTKRDLGVGAVAVAITAELYKENVSAARAYRSLAGSLRIARTTEEISDAYNEFGKAIVADKEGLKALAKAKSIVATQLKSVAAKAARTAAAL